MDTIERPILVTGGNGYLAKHLVKKLQKKKMHCVVTTRKKTGIDFEFELDITDEKASKKLIEKINPSVIIHLAADLNRTRDKNYLDPILKTNFTGTLNLLKACENIENVHFVFASTSEIYGNNKPPFSEEMQPDPTSFYSLSKLLSENAIKMMGKSGKFTYTILRIFNFFGKEMPENFFISQLVETLKKGKEFNMTNGDQKRDLLHIEDVVEAILIVLKNKKAQQQTINICRGKSLSMKGLALYIAENFRKPILNFGAIPYRENEIWDMTGDNTKISELGFKPKYSLEDGLRKI